MDTLTASTASARIGIPDFIHRIAEAGGLAPSGGNNQPWGMLYDGARLWLRHDGGRHGSHFDVDLRATHLALGAALENMVIAAAHEGYRAEVETFPCVGDMSIAAALGFIPSSDMAQDIMAALHPHIAGRVTNRRQAPRRSLMEDHVQALRAAGAVHGGHVRFIEDPERLVELGALLGEADVIRFLCPALHRELFSEVRWTPAEVEHTRDGIDVATLEMASAEIKGLSWLSNPTLAWLLGVTGAASTLAKPSRQAAMKASSMGLISVTGCRPEDQLRGGRAVERLWLEATALGLAFQPMTVVIYMFEMLRAGAADLFTRRQRARLEHLRAKFERLFPMMEDECRLMVFRVARDVPAPTVRALRRPVDAFLRTGAPAILAS